MSLRAGNILGELTAESDDKMLDTAFYESRNFRELVHGTAFRFVVGRRGTGKSALFRKIFEALQHEQGVVVLTERPSEDATRAFHHELAKLTNDYADARVVTRLTWKVQILTEALDAILGHYKSTKLESHGHLAEYRARFPPLFAQKGLERGLVALRLAMAAFPNEPASALPEKIAQHFDVGWLQNCVLAALHELRRRVVYLYDGLDEGWIPTQIATSLLGGLAKAAVEFREAHHIHCLIFVRDNMFRALAEFDGDYTRNIEGNTLRIFWDDESLLNLVALRLRAAFEWRGENNIKAWNRFAQRGLDGHEGFKKCLRLTLYRPRDIIALLNGAFQVACAHGRESIIDTDIDATARRISQTRLNDLFKEYDKVLPGLQQFAQIFRGQPTPLPYGVAKGLLDEVVDRADATGSSTRDFALLRTGSVALNALYSVGFVGLQGQNDTVRFCHDGSNADVEDVPGGGLVVVHPCYWLAMGIVSSRTDGEDRIAPEISVSVVDDEDDVALADAGKKEMTDLRLRQLGVIVEELHGIQEGLPGAHAFEEWVYSAARYLFPGGLSNIQWKPNSGQVQQRDVVGTLIGDKGFWRRIGRYDVSQFVIEAKNFREIDADGFRQAWGYLNGPYGRCIMIVTRSGEDSISEHERALVKEGYDGDVSRMVILMPAKLLQRALSKMRSGGEKRDDYTMDLLNKRLDLFERSYIAQKSARVSRK